MSEWLKLDTGSLNTAHEKEINGVKVLAQLSPHDVPVAARAIRAAGSVLIELQYLDDEPWNLVHREPGVICRIGRHSGRLFGIELSDEFIRARQNFTIALESVNPINPTDQYRQNLVSENYRISTAAIANRISDLVTP